MELSKSDLDFIYDFCNEHLVGCDEDFNDFYCLVKQLVKEFKEN